MTEQEQVDLLRGEMDKQGIIDPQLRAGIGALAGGESGFNSHSETGYAHTSNDRIRNIFGSRVAALSDDQLNGLKANPEEFFNRVYGGTWGLSNLGNSQPGDGFKFRGRGLFQLTGRANYMRYGVKIGRNLTSDPEVANEPAVAAAIAVAYIRDRYKGDGWPGMKRAVGNNIPDIDATKNSLFMEYLANGKFAPMADVPPAVVTAKADDPEVVEFLAAVAKIQTFLTDKGFYKGAIDCDFGGASRLALDLYRRPRE